MKFTGHRAKLRIVSFQTLIDAKSLQALLGDSELAVVDCRFDLMDPGAGRRAYLAGHLPGARYAGLDSELSSPVSAETGRHPLPQPERLAQTEQTAQPAPQGLPEQPEQPDLLVPRVPPVPLVPPALQVLPEMLT